MGYFKFTQQEEITDVIENPVWVRQDHRGRIVRCGVEDAAGVLSSDESIVYHIAGTRPFMDIECEEIFVADITEAEYKELCSIMQLGGIVTEAEIIWDEPETETVDEPESKDLLEVKLRHLASLSSACQTAIFQGVDVEMTDGSVRHFDLKIEDQINLISLSPAANDGMEIPYHASGCLCEYFSAEDFLRVVTAAKDYKTYHTSYFNSLKNWVMSMNSITEVTDVNYGDTVPEEYCSDVYLRLEGVKNT